jgi:hypothetical protein
MSKNSIYFRTSNTKAKKTEFVTILSNLSVDNVFLYTMIVLVVTRETSSLARTQLCFA